MTIEHKRSSKGEIEDLIKARYSLIWITSPEENRVEEALKRLCVEREMRLEVWSITEGFKTVANGQGTRDVKDPMKAIDHVLRAEGRSLFVLRDFHPFLKEPAVVRRLRDAATEVYEAINDILSEMRNNMRLVQGELPNLKADGQTLEAVTQAVEALVDSAETAKGALRGLRDLANAGS